MLGLWLVVCAVAWVTAGQMRGLQPAHPQETGSLVSVVREWARAAYLRSALHSLPAPRVGTIPVHVGTGVQDPRPRTCLLCVGHRAGRRRVGVRLKAVNRRRGGAGSAPAPRKEREGETVCAGVCQRVRGPPQLSAFPTARTSLSPRLLPSLSGHRLPPVTSCPGLRVPAGPLRSCPSGSALLQVAAPGCLLPWNPARPRGGRSGHTC